MNLINKPRLTRFISEINNPAYFEGMSIGECRYHWKKHFPHDCHAMIIGCSNGEIAIVGLANGNVALWKRMWNKYTPDSVAQAIKWNDRYAYACTVLKLVPFGDIMDYVFR